ncbi:MAG TPA: Ig-like domain-containing protein [Longimicrobium sp.]|nr:Ig-like domain-containing protein [Longimicrobium sp.]
MKLSLPGRSALAWCLPLFLLSCVGDRTPTAAPDGASVDRMTGVRIFIVSGNNQVGTPGQPLAQPLVVRVVDQRDRPVADAVVNWLVKDGGGSADPRQGRTDADGFASAVWTMGPEGGEASLRASGTGGTVVFNASVRPSGSTVTLVKVSGDGQTAAPGAALPEPLVVRARDGAGAPVAGVVVRWSALAGGGTVSPGESATDADGLARTSWTLGSTTDAQSATAIGSGSVVTFTATARQPGAGGTPVVMYIVKNPVWAEPGDSVRMRAVFLDDDGEVVPGPEVRWSLLSGSNATIDPSGLVRVRAQGPERVIAEAGAFTAWAELNPWSGRDRFGAPLPALYLLPRGATLEVGQSLRLRAVRMEADGTARAVRDAEWQSLSNYASVVGGVARGLKPGNGAIVARSGGLSAMASLAVTEASTPPGPRITSISVTPERADVSTGPAAVRVVVRALDPDGGPAVGFQVEAASPGFTRYTCGPAGPPETSSECVLDIPAGAEAGTYTLRSVKVWDAAGRVATYDLVRLREAGVRSFFEIQNHPFDALPPAVVELRVDEPVSGIFLGRVASRVHATLRDASGVRSATLRTRSPSGAQGAECRLVTVSGNVVEGAWSCDMALPVEPETGNWRVSAMELIDRAGNRAKLGEAELRAQGITTAFRVGGRPQPSGLLAGFSMEPSRGKVGRPIYASLQVTNGAGKGYYASITLRAPDGYERWCYSQTRPDGSWRCPTTPQPGQAGTWTVLSVYIRSYDFSEEQRWETADLKRLGYMAEFEVDP